MELEAYLERARTDELRRRAYSAMAFVTPALLIFEATTYRVNKSDLLSNALVGLILLFNVGRFFHVKYSKESPQDWQRTEGKLALVAGILWGSLAFRNLTLAHNEPSLEIVTFLVGLGLVSGSIFSLSIQKTFFRLYTTPFLLGMAAAALLNSTTLTDKIASCLVFALFLSFTNIQRGLVEKDWIATQTHALELQALVDSFPGGIVRVSGGKAVQVNSFFKSRMTKLNGELDPQSVLEILIAHPEFAREFNRFSENVSASRTEFEFFLELEGQKRAFWFLLTRSQVKSQEIVVVGIDIQARKDAEAQIEQQRARLEASTKMAALGEMTGGIAHEVNNPVSVISSRAELMLLQLPEGSELRSQWKPHIDVILATCERIARIIRGLLAITKGTEGEEFQKVPLRPLIDQIVDLCQARVGKAGVKLQVLSFDPSIEVEAKPVLLSQVVLNLLNNAFDAVEGSHLPWITISVACPGDDIEIAVMDSGPGVDPAIQDKIMFPFFTTKKQGKGTGLGLSISSGILKAHRGILFLDPESSHTRFVARLPRKQTPVSAT